MNFQVSEANAPKDSTMKDYRSCGILARVRGRRASDRVLVFSILASYQVVRVDRVDVVLIVLVTPQSGFAALVNNPKIYLSQLYQACSIKSLAKKGLKMRACEKLQKIYRF